MYYADGTRVDGSNSFTNGECIEEELCNVFTMDNYVPTAYRVYELEDGFKVFLCHDFFFPGGSAAGFMEDTIIPEYLS